jgi:hypothetical protein
VTPTAQQVFDYADRFARRRERAGKGTQYPTLRDAARRFRCRIGDIEDAVESSDFEDGYLGIAVALGIPGVGSRGFDCRGDCLVEAYK